MQRKVSNLKGKLNDIKSLIILTFINMKHIKPVQKILLINYQKMRILKLIRKLKLISTYIVYY